MAVMTALTQLQLSGWKSIKDATVEFRPLNVLLGANGAGKSNLLSFLRFLQALVQGRAGEFVGRAGGADTLLHFGIKTTQHLTTSLTASAGNESVTFESRLDYSPPDSLVPNVHGDHAWPANAETISNLNVHGDLVGWIRERAGLSSGAAIVQELFKRLNYCHFHDTSISAAVRTAVYLEDNRALRADAGNLAALLYLYQQTQPWHYQRIVRTTRQVAPFFGDFILQPQKLNPQYIILNWRMQGHDYELGPHQFSDGTLRAISLITLLLQPEADLPPLIAIDEPEIGLHPYALGIIAGLIRALAQRTQLVIATQSPLLVDHFTPDDIIVTELDRGLSSFRRLGSDELMEWVEEYSLGELWEKNVFGGTPRP
jgi:predicted ATPase